MGLARISLATRGCSNRTSIEPTRRMGASTLPILILLMTTAVLSLAQEKISIIPQPAQLTEQAGYFVVDGQTQVLVAGSLAQADTVAQQLAQKLRAVTGFALPVSPTADTGSAHDAILYVVDNAGGFGAEEYRLTATTSKVTITAAMAPGFFYATQTLYQLMPAQVEAATQQTGLEWKIPCVVIRDKPRFRWRGMHLDVARHFFPADFVKKYIDILAMYKMNMFHWHLTDDQGWRIEIKQYPLLTEIGGHRNETNGDGIPYSGFYTQDQIREVVEYARQRYVEIIPEIEMPGHSMAALASYPWLSCTGGPFQVGTYWGGYNDVFCAGKDSSFVFLENVLTEVMSLFPGRYIHVGGDEVPTVRWQNHTLDQLRIQNEGLGDVSGLEPYFIKRIETFLVAHGRTLIGWDEILNGGLDSTSAVMAWRSVSAGAVAAQSGHDVVMSPYTSCYFDFGQAPSPPEPPANNWAGFPLPLETVYAFDPMPPGLAGPDTTHVLGAQANLWSELIPTQDHAEYMLLPRLCALSEGVWSPLAARNLQNFTQRLSQHFTRLSLKDISYRPLPTPLFDGTSLGEQVALMSFWGEGEGSGIVPGAGARLGSDAVKWIEGTTGAESGVSWTLAPVLDIHTTIGRLVFNCSLKVPPESDSLWIGFTSTNGRRLGLYVPPNWGQFDNKWRALSLPLSNWGAEPGFDSSNVEKLSVSAPHAQAGLTLYLADLWIGFPTSNPLPHSPILFFDGYAFEPKFTSTIFGAADAASGIVRGAGTRPGTSAVRWVVRSSAILSQIKWQFPSPTDLRPIIAADTFKINVKVPQSVDSLTFQFVGSNFGKLDYTVGKTSGLFDSTWHNLAIPLRDWVAHQSFVGNDISSFYIQARQPQMIPGPTLYLSDIWIGTPPDELISSVTLADAHVPAAFALEQNYPNPFNPSTTIQFSIPLRGKVVLRIFDILGREVTTLVNEEHDPGTYRVNWSGVNVASGVYFYRIDCGSFVKSAKMILLK